MAVAVLWVELPAPPSDHKTNFWSPKQQSVGTSAHPSLQCMEVRASHEGCPQDPHPTQHRPALQCMGSSDGVGMPQSTGSAAALFVPHVSSSWSAGLRQRLCQALATHSTGHSAQRAPCCPQASVTTWREGGDGDCGTTALVHTDGPPQSEQRGLEPTGHRSSSTLYPTNRRLSQLNTCCCTHPVSCFPSSA